MKLEVGMVLGARNPGRYFQSYKEQDWHHEKPGEVKFTASNQGYFMEITALDGGTYSYRSWSMIDNSRIEHGEKTGCALAELLKEVEAGHLAP